LQKELEKVTQQIDRITLERDSLMKNLESLNNLDEITSCR
jgi:prefoldin subunit 5